MVSFKKEKFNFISELKINKDSAIPFHLQLAGDIKYEIINKKVSPGTILPSEREIVRQLGVHRDTIHNAYELLVDDGFLERRQGRRGVFVAEEIVEKYKPSFPSVGILMPSGFSEFVKASNRFSMNYLGGIIDRAAELRHSTNIVTLPTPNEKQEKINLWMKNITAHSRGIIYLSARGLIKDRPFRSLLENKFIPHVFVSGYSTLEHVNSVVADFSSSGNELAELLWNYGHRKIGIFRSSWNVKKNNIFKYQAEKRANMMLEFFNNKGLKCASKWTAENCFSEKQVRSEVDRIFSLKEKPTAIWCQNDDNAFAVLEALRQKGLKVPDDISLAGFDDIEAETPTKAFLTTIKQPSVSIGKQAVDLAIDLSNKAPQKGKTLKIKTSLVIRKSVGMVKK